ncbi:MAG TPA: PEP-CTERM sorting domain-containing protein [Verrucomicrobiae bacterium]|nr:PEP-CTERM sorting domain-containing protein [Verrucomicrobiae bacterium]
MKLPITLSLAALCGVVAQSQAATLLNDTFADGARNDQNLPTSSQWYRGGVGTLDVVAPGGPLRGDLGAGATGSASWTTYFAGAGNAVVLANAGDTLRLTWQFSLTGIGAQNNSQNFRLAVVDTPDANRLAADGAPGNAAYAGYGMFMNLAPVLGNSNPYQLMERVDPNTASAMLSAGASWVGLGNGATTGNTGYVEGTQYTLTMEFMRNALDGLDITSTMSGGSLNNSGTATVSVSDATPNSFSFDTFSIRPSNATGAAQIFDTGRLTVEFIPVPEPSAFALVGLGLAGLAIRRSRRA